jgi:reverse gyrase
MGRLLIAYDSALSSEGEVFTEGRVDEIAPLLNEALAESEAEFYEFFTRVTSGLKPWGAQRAWIKRLLRGENTVLVAPTGVGKTTLLLVYALYSATRNKKVLYVVPTKSLGDQVYSKLAEMISRYSKNPRILYYNSSLRGKSRERVIKSISSGDFDILVVTSAFLRRLPTYYPHTFTVVIVDDADSLVKNEKNIYVLLSLLGYSREDIELSKRRVELVRRIVIDKVVGRETTTLIKELIEVDMKLESSLRVKNLGQLVVASATCYTRGVAGKILRDLLKVDINGITIYGRDVTDVYIAASSIDEVVAQVIEVIKRLGKGGVIYLSPRNPKKEFLAEALRRIQEFLSRSGLKFSEATPRAVLEMTKGNIDFLIGYSSYYSSSVRGIDAPKSIKYVIFLGTPVFSITLESFLANPLLLVRTALEIADMTRDQGLKNRAVEVRKRVLLTGPTERKLIKYSLLGKIPENSLLEKSKLSELYAVIKELYNLTLLLVKNIIDSTSVLSIGTITLTKSGGKYLAVIPDIMTYIQASGRTSRLLGDKMTHGFSLVVEFSDQENLVKALNSKLKTLDRELELKHISEVDLDREKIQLESTRSLLDNAEGLKYKSILLVVESPVKAKTIARFFGKPVARKIADMSIYTIPVKIGGEIVEFNVVSTRGHIYDITTKSGVGIFGVEVTEGFVKPMYTTIRRCKICGAQFTDHDSCPRCGSSVYSDSKLVVYLLQKLALEVDEVYIATDPDIEGEKIAYDIYASIKPFNQNIWRIELHEITRSELLRALSSKRLVNWKLVEAEVYRRVLDRLVGFSLSLKLQRVFNERNLGIGRVQGPLLDFIVKRYHEYLSNKCKKICVSTREPVKLKLCTYLDTVKLLEKLRAVSSVELIKLQEEVVEVNPRPPYTTEELLVDASNKLGLQAEVAMKIAQELYEAGLITYHRTDCTYISNTGLSIAKAYLEGLGLSALFTPRHWGEPGAHEAIRPTNPYNAEQLLRAFEEGLVQLVIPLTSRHLALYDLIFKRFITSQMKSYKALRSRFKVLAEGVEIGEVELTEYVLEHGFDLVEKPRIYTQLRGVERAVLEVESIKVFNSSKTPLYTEGDLVSLMKTHGVGRPSTYSKILSNLKRHGYIILSKARQKVVPTKRGITVHKYLVENYSKYLSVELTRRMEEAIDRISRGELDVYKAIIDIIINLITANALEISELPSNLYNYISLHPPSYRLAPNINTL